MSQEIITNPKCLLKRQFSSLVNFLWLIKHLEVILVLLKVHFLASFLFSYLLPSYPCPFSWGNILLKLCPRLPCCFQKARLFFDNLLLCRDPRIVINRTQNSLWSLIPNSILTTTSCLCMKTFRVLSPLPSLYISNRFLFTLSCPNYTDAVFHFLNLR